MSSAWGQSTDLILAVLSAGGEMTQADIREETGVTLSTVSRTMQRLIEDCPTYGQRAHIVRWITTVDEGREYPRPVYVAGPGPNARKRLQDRRQRLKKKREAWRARKMLRKGVSVFHLSIPDRELSL